MTDKKKVIESQLRTFCCQARYRKVDKSKWICEKCKKDVSTDLIMLVNALVKDEHG